MTLQRKLTIANLVLFLILPSLPLPPLSPDAGQNQTQRDWVAIGEQVIDNLFVGIEKLVTHAITRATIFGGIARGFYIGLFLMGVLGHYTGVFRRRGRDFMWLAVLAGAITELLVPLAASKS